jgi:hypothetical protein
VPSAALSLSSQLSSSRFTQEQNSRHQQCLGVINIFNRYRFICFTCQVAILGYITAFEPWELIPALDSTPLHIMSFLNTGLLNRRGTRNGHITVSKPINSRLDFSVTKRYEETGEGVTPQDLNSTDV